MQGEYTTAPASPGYEGLYHAGAEMSIAETAARMNELERDNAGLLALLREIDYAEPARAEWLLAHAREQEHPGRELMARTLEEVVSLRLQLASADEHVEALTRGGQVAFAAASILRQLVRNNLIKGEYTHDEARIAVAYFEETAFGPALSAARAWLRRGA